MFKFLEGKKTILTAVLGLVVGPIANTILGLDIGSHVSAFLNTHACGTVPGDACLNIVADVSKQLQQVYLTVVGGLIVHFRLKANK